MLSKKLIPLAFGQGLDTKRDKKQQLYGTLRKAENVVFETLDSARKRNGYDAIPLLRITNNASVTAEYLAAFRNELLAFTNTTLYSYSSGLGKLQERGSVYSVFPTNYPVVNNGFDNIQVDMLIVGDLRIFAYQNKSTSEIRYCVQDALNQTMLVSDELVAAGGIKPRLSYINDKVFIFYASGTNVYYRTFTLSNPLVLQPQATFVSNLQSVNSVFEVVLTGSVITIAYGSQDATYRLYINTITYNGVSGTAKKITEAVALTAIEMFIDTGSRLIVAYSTGTVVKYLMYNSALVPLPGFASPVTVESGLSAVANIMVAEIQPNSYNIYYSISAASAYNYYVRYNSVDNAGSVDTAAVFLRSVSLASKSFIVDGNSYFIVSYESLTQPTYFVINTDGVIVTKISSGVSGGHVQSSVLPDVQVSGTVATVATLYKTKLVADNGDFYSLNGVQTTVMEFADVNRFQNSTLNNNMVIGGGVVQMYDGDVVSEHGFNVYPEKPVFVTFGGTPNNNSGVGAILPGTYYYSAVYKWTDQYGQEHRSAPSEELAVTIAAPNNAITINVPSLRLTQKADVTIELYRTEGSLSGTVLYLVNDATAPLKNNPAADTVQFIDGLPDYTGVLPNETLVLANRRTLYTTGGVLDNIAPPSAKLVATHTASQRIFLAGLEQPNELLYSKIAFPGQPVEFNDALRIVVDPIGGKIAAIASMDEKLIIFKEDATMFIAGGGPNNLGQQDSFTRPERVSIDIGCIEPKSIVLTPDGLMFKSRKGIFLLSRVLEMSYIGAPVEEFNSLTITSAKVVGELNQVRFTTIDGDTLVYNYVFKLWSTFTNHKARAAEVIGNDYYYLRQIENGVLYKENRTSYSDAGTSIKMRLEIGWISFAILQGYTRIYKMMVLGDWYSSHNLLVQVGYDFKEVWSQQALITPATAGFEATAYGNDSPYGAGSPYGGTGSPYQARVDFKQQKCQSMKLLIEDVQETAGQGFSLSQITFEVGGKSGLFKLGKGKKFGTT